MQRLMIKRSNKDGATFLEDGATLHTLLSTSSYIRCLLNLLDRPLSSYDIKREDTVWLLTSSSNAPYPRRHLAFGFEVSPPSQPAHQMIDEYQ
jgi:hypothetical protein